MAGRILERVLGDLGIGRAAQLSLSGDQRPPALSSSLAVAECAVAAVGACLEAAAELAAARTGRLSEVSLDVDHVAAAVRSEAWLRDPTGNRLAAFAPLSRMWPAADGWVRTHANYPWHRSALLNAFHVTGGGGVAERLGPAISELPAGRVEETAFAAGGLAVAARTSAGWRATEQGRAVDTLPLVAFEPLGEGGPPLREPGPLPASGLRVLDLTRVIAGPVGTRMLGALGAEVLRIDDPRRPELPALAVEGVIGKASALLDARGPSGAAALHDLLDGADVLVTGYRPGALRRFGLDPDQVAERHPGTVVVTLSAWGTVGPWGSRRGFDSLVQVATGIGLACSPDGERPGALPCQLLDHATGYLLAAGALAALAERARTGRTAHVGLALARTARWLLDQGTREDEAPAAARPQSDPAPYRVALGDGWTGIGPPGLVDGRPLSWPHLPPGYCRAKPAWP